MTKDEIFKQYRQEIEAAERILSQEVDRAGGFLDCGTPYILAKLEAKMKREKLLREHGYSS